MSILLFHYLTINTKEDFLNRIRKLTDLAQNVAKYYVPRPFKLAKVFQKFSKVAKFCQIWSH